MLTLAKDSFILSLTPPRTLNRVMPDMNGKEAGEDVIKKNNWLFNKDIYIRTADSNETYILEAEHYGQKITTQVVVQ